MELQQYEISEINDVADEYPVVRRALLLIDHQDDLIRELRLIVWSILDSVDILNDGPDDSDKANAEHIFSKALAAAKEIRKQTKV